MGLLAIEIEVGTYVVVESRLEAGVAVSDVGSITLVYDLLELVYIGLITVAGIDEVKGVALGEAVFEVEVGGPVHQVLCEESTVHLLSEDVVRLIGAGVEVYAVAQIELGRGVTHIDIDAV